MRYAHMQHRSAEAVPSSACSARVARDLVREVVEEMAQMLLGKTLALLASVLLFDWAAGQSASE